MQRKYSEGVIMSKKPIDYAKHACDTMMRKFAAEDLPPKGRFHYHQGVFLSGVHKTYQLCAEEKYFEYMAVWMNSVIDKNGKVLDQDGVQMDDMQPGILLYPMIARFGEGRYKTALDYLMGMFETYPRNDDGGLWHKDIYPNQMWLDGLYMGGPVCAEYGGRYNSRKHIDFVVQQACLMQKHTKDNATGLWYHAWDQSRKAKWCDPKTGLSPEFWGRSIGWVPVALLDDLDFIPKDHPGYAEVCKITVDLLLAVCRYQDDGGLWYQVVNKGGQAGNWLETSCSCLFIAAICKAVGKGILDRKYLQNAKKGYNAVIASLEYDGDNVLIGKVCVGTGVGDYKHYCERPTSTNDLHGVGAFLIMCTEVQRVYDRM